MKTAEDILNAKPADDMFCIGPQATVAEAIEKMATKNIGAILIKSENRYEGIWTERDLLHSMAKKDFDPQTAVIGDHMKRRLHTAAHDASLLELEEMLLGLFIRHILVVKDGRTIGLLSIGDVLRASLLEKDRQIKELNSIASWQYYENWGWDRKKKSDK